MRKNSYNYFFDLKQKPIFFFALIHIYITINIIFNSVFMNVSTLNLPILHIKIKRYNKFSQSNMETKSVPQLSFTQKYALKYYIFLIPQILTASLLIITNNAPLALASNNFFNNIGRFLPIKAKDQRHLSKVQSNNVFLLGPLIASCLSTPVILYIIWRNYQYLVKDSLSYNVTLVFVVGFLISGSIDAAHELLHRTQPICQYICYMTLFFFQLTIYPTEHLYLHHKKVGTPEDPITSPKNQSVYRYYINALISCHKFNYRYSKSIFFMNVGATILYNALLVLFSIKSGSGIYKALFFSAISYASIFLMEAVEYIEHYGLIYRKDENTKPVTQQNSWNTSQNQILNFTVFRFQNHADHHMHAYKRYPLLHITQKMPQFPFDFISAILVSLIPPLWYKLINPLVDEVIQGKSVTKEYKDMIGKVFLRVQIVIVVMFPVKFVEYLLF